MTDPITLTFPSLLWKFLLKLPLVGRWLLRWRYSASRCHAGLLINMDGSQPSFEMGDNRHVFSLTSLLIQAHNHLPFAVTIDLFQMKVFVGSDGLMDSVQNLQLILPAFSSSQKILPEAHLNDRQAEWLIDLGHESTNIIVEFHCRCQSSVQAWEVHRSAVLLASINAAHPRCK